VERELDIEENLPNSELAINCVLRFFFFFFLFVDLMPALPLPTPS
jgi:hypothetical protein